MPKQSNLHSFADICLKYKMSLCTLVLFNASNNCRESYCENVTFQKDLIHVHSPNSSKTYFSLLWVYLCEFCRNSKGFSAIYRSSEAAASVFFNAGGVNNSVSRRQEKSLNRNTEESSNRKSEIGSWAAD